MINYCFHRGTCFHSLYQWHVIYDSGTKGIKDTAHWLIWCVSCTAPPHLRASSLTEWMASQTRSGWCCDVSQNLSFCPVVLSRQSRAPHTWPECRRTWGPGPWGSPGHMTFGAENKACEETNNWQNKQRESCSISYLVRVLDHLDVICSKLVWVEFQ